MTKIYGISGQTTAVINIPFNGGLGSIECEFRRGVIGRGPNNRPATFATSDPAVQAIIENSAYYGHRIKLVRSIDDGGHVSDAKATPVIPAEPEVKEYPDVTTKEEAVAFLKAHGAKATNLKDDEAIKKFMAKIGASFPNCAF